MSELTVFKIIMNYEFTPGSDYNIVVKRKFHNVKCLKNNNLNDAWYFYTDIGEDIIIDLFQNEDAKLQNLNLIDLDMTFLKFLEERT